MDNEQKTVQIKPPLWGLVLASIAVIVLVVYLGVLTWNAVKQHDYIGRTNQQNYTISIDGQGKVTAVPDIAQVSLGIQTQNSKAAVAQKENTDKMNQLVSALKKMNIDDKDIQTSNYSIYPQYDYSNGKQTLTGYQVTQSVTVKIRNLDSVGDVLTAAGQIGANQVGGLNFTIDDPEQLREQAREKALANAKAKADALAKAAGVKLGRLVSFMENGSSPTPIPYVQTLGLGGAKSVGVAVPAPDIQPGSEDIIVNVTVTYEVL